MKRKHYFDLRGHLITEQQFEIIWRYLRWLPLLHLSWFITSCTYLGKQNKKIKENNNFWNCINRYLLKFWKTNAIFFCCIAHIPLTCFWINIFHLNDLLSFVCIEKIIYKIYSCLQVKHTGIPTENETFIMT